MLSAAAACAAGGALCWPASRVVRSRSSLAACKGRLLHAVLAHPALLLAGGAVTLGLWRGPAFAAALVVAGLVGWRHWRAAGARRQRATATARFVEALHGMITELRRGAHPALAAAGVAETAGVGPVFASIADAARIGARVEDGLLARSAEVRHLRSELERFAVAWRLSSEHGLALAELLEALHRDLEHRVRARAKLRAQLSGARASGWVLAGLPVFGVVLGQLIGADPLGVLTKNGLGGSLLLVGIVLIAGGLTWTARLTEQAVP